MSKKRLNVILDEDLHQLVKERAVRERTTVSAIIRRLLKEWLSTNPR